MNSEPQELNQKSNLYPIQQALCHGCFPSKKEISFCFEQMSSQGHS